MTPMTAAENKVRSGKKKLRLNEIRPITYIVLCNAHPFRLFIKP